MDSWAARLTTSWPAEEAQVRQSILSNTQSPYAVLDASALIGGSEYEHVLGQRITTPDVYEEVKDRKSKEALEAIPFGIEIKEPAADAVSTVTSFARGTGDSHSLSAADIRLIALAYSLHVERYGADNLAQKACPARPVGKSKKSTRKLPGWGAGGGDWAELDKLNDDEIRAQTGQAESKVVQETEGLHLDDSNDSAERSGSESQNGGSVRGNEDQGEWQKAASSQGAARKHRRKEMRKLAKANQFLEPTSPSHISSVSLQPTESVTIEKPVNEHPESHSEDSDSTSIGEMYGSEHNSLQAREQQDSAICIVTADFAMQNVILQMGLKLVSPDGRQIKRISKWVLRCSACFKVTKEMQRLFCPICGNAALEKVEVVIGEDGAELFGVRRRHIIRGTRFSLPRPKGGKNSKDPVLREDVYMQRMPRRKPKKDSTDPFAPEYNATSWHDARYSTDGQSKGVAAALASWKHNPNERRHARTNRR